MITYNNGSGGAAQLWRLTSPGYVGINASTIGQPLLDVKSLCVDGGSSANFETNGSNPSINLNVNVTGGDYANIDINPSDIQLTGAKVVANQNTQLSINGTYGQLRTEDNTASNYSSITTYPDQITLQSINGSSGASTTISMIPNNGIALSVDGNIGLGVLQSGYLVVGNLDAPAVLTIQKKLIKVYDSTGTFQGYIEVKQ